MVVVRQASRQDEQSLSRFSCCAHTGKYGVQEIQRFVQENKALREAELFPANRYLVVTDGPEIVAVAYHVPWDEEDLFALPTPRDPATAAEVMTSAAPEAGGQLIEFRRQEVDLQQAEPPAQREIEARFVRFLALGDAWQGGKRLTFGTMAISEYVMRAVLDDIRTHSSAFIAGGKIHKDNVRSLGLVEKLGWDVSPAPNSRKMMLALTPLYSA